MILYERIRRLVAPSSDVVDAAPVLKTRSVDSVTRAREYRKLENPEIPSFSVDSSLTKNPTSDTVDVSPSSDVEALRDRAIAAVLAVFPGAHVIERRRSL